MGVEKKQVNRECCQPLDTCQAGSCPSSKGIIKIHILNKQSAMEFLPSPSPEEDKGRIQGRPD